jgi:cytochrome c-type biogenesis protein CcsB
MNAQNWEQNWYYTSLALLGTGLVFYTLVLVKPKALFKEGGWGCVLLSMLCLVSSLIVRSNHAQYFALSNMYESLLSVSIGIHLAFLVFDRWFRLRLLGVPVLLMLLTSLLYNLQLPTEIHPLQPALQSYWRSIHVPIILLSYALFTLSFLSAVIFLVQSQLARWKGLSEQPSVTLGADRLLTEQTALHQGLGLSGISDVRDYANLYDEITYRCVAFGFPLLTLGIILGGIWANEAWGNYWSWDPKESMSLVTLLGYGVYLHLRINGEHPPKTLAWVSVIGFILMLITYFGVNLMGVGLHSYGRIG